VKRTETGRPALSWCLIARNAEKTIEATLKSLRERTPDAEIVIVDTCSSDSTVEIAKRYADVFEVYKGPLGDWDEKMPFFDDAAAARNCSFGLASGKWIGWIDADDVLPGPEEAERLLKENGRWCPGKPAKGFEAGPPVALEDLLELAASSPQAPAVFWAPYLYRRNEDGTAAEWQERERFVRNDGTFHWVGKGHEVLVPKNGAHGTPGILSSLLFLHMKEWKGADYQFSVIRHYNALIKEYDKGDRSARTCLYLENFARSVCPWRRGEFLKEAYEHAYNHLDRCRALIRAGEYAAENAFYMDAIEAFSAATAIRPDLPDPWLAGAMAFEHAEDWIRAAEWYEHGIACRVNPIESLANPRDLLIGYPVKAADCWRRAMQRQTREGAEASALEAARRRYALLTKARDSEAAGPDREVLMVLTNWAENDLGALERLDDIRRLFDLLVRNEETKKASQLVKIIPHMLEDHPVVMGMRRWAEKVDRHLGDPRAYSEFYNNAKESGALFDVEVAFGPLPPARTQFLIEWLKREKPNARILEIGCFDGPVGIHVLRACPDVSYVGIDTMKEALAHFQARAEKEGTADRLKLYEGLDLDDDPELRRLRFDVIVFYEIIEHVPDPTASLRNLASKLRPGGKIFVSTPWGAGDRGRPYNLETRDPRGHVRAMTAKELHDAVTTAGYQVIEQGGANAMQGAGLHLIAEKDQNATRSPLSFYVNSALWGWNASHVERTGIGASEETIVYLARELAKDPARLVSVFGPVPDDKPNRSEEVQDRVGYWTREKIVGSKGPIIVSRAPAAGRGIDSGGKRDKILWLQDSFYPDLTPNTARDYRKIVVLTGWHKKIMAEAIKEEAHRLEIVPNFLLRDHFKRDGASPREPHHFVYASSPDRGLVRLLRIWPRILALYPDSTLDIFYGWEGCMVLGGIGSPSWVKYYRAARTAYMELRWQKGVNERGRVNHETLAREFQRASAWLYPTAFAETGCLTAAKTRAAGCVPVTTRYAGLAETGECPQTVWVDMPGVGVIEDPTSDPAAFDSYADRFLEGVKRAVETSEVDRSRMSEEAIEKFDIEAILPLWLRLLEG
jgi:2-polyprenyl-3-methyl-5-hydroxy-6-metoxy-1,4-benzoquinol methylase